MRMVRPAHGYLANASLEARQTGFFFFLFYERGFEEFVALPFRQQALQSIVSTITHGVVSRISSFPCIYFKDMALRGRGVTCIIASGLCCQTWGGNKESKQAKHCPWRCVHVIYRRRNRLRTNTVLFYY